MATGHVHTPQRSFTGQDLVEQDTFAEKGETGPTEHPAFEHPDSVDATFDDARAPGQSGAEDNRILVTVDTCGECVKAEFVSPDGIEPLRQPFALAFCEYLADGADVACESVQFRVVDQSGLEPKGLGLGEGLRPVEDPSGDAPG
ncbi:hypothetical protein [Streptomyces sp. NPDC088730]|uniref:hypothetical protein n=1 Tax=Streptomyces sp. NPDC088730 TaxID=3365877 RepID=UPI003807692A